MVLNRSVVLGRSGSFSVIQVVLGWSGLLWVVSVNILGYSRSFWVVLDLSGLF